MKLRTIKSKSTNGISITVVGFRNKEWQPYLTVEASPTQYGYIEDRDVKRLLEWCRDCLKKRRTKP